VCDVTDAGGARAAIRANDPEVVIHAQALSDVDRCEREPALARQMNVEAIANVIAALAPTEALLMFISTDYVFDGRKGAPYDERDEPRPISVYGASKLEGEHVALSYPRAVVVRPSTLFGPGRVNFCDAVVSRLRAGETAEAFSDQATSPTYTEDLAAVLRDLAIALRARPLAEWPTHIVHGANAGGCSRVEFAHRIADLLGASRAQIRAIRMAEQHRPARRPACSVLATRYLPALIGRSVRSWDEALQAYLRG
jgi:dTDP-4-dehydrorhamnose reductase